MTFVGAVIIANLVGLVLQAPPVSASPAAVPAAPMLDRFFAPDPEPLVSYRAVRHLTASTRGGKMQASLDVVTTLNPQTGFTYEITHEDGSDLIRRRVLVAALEAERQSFAHGDTKTAALTRDNYEFPAVTSTDDGLVRLDVHPKYKRVVLIDGSLFLNADSGRLVRLDGDLSQRPSFWTRRVHVRREYAMVDGVHVPVSMRSTADVLIVGKSDFAMTYDYLEINGHPVVSPGH